MGLGLQVGLQGGLCGKGLRIDRSRRWGKRVRRLQGRVLGWVGRQGDVGLGLEIELQRGLCSVSLRAEGSRRWGL